MIYDVIIIGSGPSAVVAADYLSTKLNVLILEKGKDLDHRKDPQSGWFGRGVFTIGRLMLEDDCLRNEKLFNEGLELFKKNSKWEPKNAMNYCMPPINCGLKLALYYLKKLSKVDVIYDAEVVSITKDKAYFKIATENSVFYSKKCIIATGRNSYTFIDKFCKTIGILMENANIEVGVRVEMPTSVFNKIIDLNENFNMDCDTAYCDDTYHGSFVYELEENDVMTAFAHTIPDKKTDKTSFMVGFEANSNSEEVMRIVKIVNILSNDRLKKEKIKDYMNNSTVLQHLELFSGLKEAFAKIHEVIPSFIDVASMYVPEIKFHGALPVNSKMKTAIPGLYGIGECTTRSNTIIGAMASGIQVSRTILGEIK